MRKVSSLLLAGSLMVGITGCDEFLEPEPETFAASTTYYTTPQQFEQAVTGLYGSMRGLYGGNYRTLTDFRSDLVSIQYNPGIPGFTFVVDEFSEAANDGNVSGQWQSIFQTIFDANVILTRIDAVSFPTQAQKDRIIAEARFIRALAMWQGLQFWGIGQTWEPGALAIPIITSEVSEPAQAFEIERSTVQQVYDFIVTELTAAKAGLPLRGSAGATGANAGRITRGAAAFLLGATHQLNPAASEQAKALAQFEEVAAQGYALVAAGTPASGNNAYRQVFNPANKNNVESILEIQYNGSPGITNTALFQNLVPGMAPLNSAGGGTGGNAARVNPFQNTGNGAYMPTPDHVLSYQGANPASAPTPFDLRYEGGFGAFCPGSGVSGVLGVADVVTAGQAPNTQWPDLNIPSLRDPVNKTTRANCIAYYTKWRWPESMAFVNNAVRDNTNWIVFRYADLLLRRAEALVRLGRAAEAKPFVDQVRARAGLPALAAAPTLNDILQERAWELSGEGHRWFDLKRFGVASQVMEAHGNFLKARNNTIAPRNRTIQPDTYRLTGPFAFRLRYPVRPRDVTLSGGQIAQNPGW